ncbi:MAG TPA: TolC family protein [Candidatus Dormibacteraeota bacterium]|nr:TolC family protein [Candidatus Dormibacteraeota bacterium]
MHAIGKRIAPLIAIFLLAGCAAQRYAPAPINAAATASQFESRSLADPGLRSFEESCLGHTVSTWPPKTWNLQTLSLAALYFNPALDVARARLATAAAAIQTAKARPNPTFDFVPGVPAPYLLTQDFLFLVETAGKRGLRVQIARNLDQAAQFGLADSAWTVVMGVRASLLNYLVASRNLELLRSEIKIREDQVAILKQVLSAGEITGLDVNLARMQVSKTQVAIRAAEGQTAGARAALAAAIGIPEAGFDAAEFSWPGMDAPPAPETLSENQIQREAVLNRLDIRRSLAQYAAAEATLHSEIARQYPNFNLGPGYTYEEGHSLFTLGLSTSLPVFNRNQGPIAEAESRRREAAAAFVQAQAQVIARSEHALGVYTAARKEAADAASLYQLQETQSRIVRQTIRAGADDRMSLDGAQIQLSILARARLDALDHAQQALGNLEDAVQRPLGHDGVFAIRPDSPALRKLPELSRR